MSTSSIWCDTPSPNLEMIIKNLWRTIRNTDCKWLAVGYFLVNWPAAVESSVGSRRRRERSENWMMMTGSCHVQTGAGVTTPPPLPWFVTFLFITSHSYSAVKYSTVQYSTAWLIVMKQDGGCVTSRLGHSTQMAHYPLRRRIHNDPPQSADLDNIWMIFLARNGVSGTILTETEL